VQTWASAGTRPTPSGAYAGAAANCGPGIAFKNWNQWLASEDTEMTNQNSKMAKSAPAVVGGNAHPMAWRPALEVAVRVGDVVTSIQVIVRNSCQRHMSHVNSNPELG
jgi:hypothetical protein